MPTPSTNFTDCNEIATRPVLLRLLGMADLSAYKALRDTMLLTHPEAFTSDAGTECGKMAEVLVSRLGLGRSDGGHFTLGAFERGALVGALACERDPRRKVHHIAHLAGLMVRPPSSGRGIGRALLQACIERARRVAGLEQLTLSVTATNLPALHLYRSIGFVRYGIQPRALRLGDQYHDKELMLFDLAPPGMRYHR